MKPVLRQAARSRIEAIALQERRGLGLAAVDPLDPRDLAERLGIETLSLEAFRKAHPNEVRQLVEVNPRAFSGALVPFEDRKVIVFNPIHSPHRQKYTICHELAHELLGHMPTPPFDRRMKRHFNPIEEAEADCLAEALLMPLLAVRPVLRRFDNDLRAAAEHFGIDEDLVRARLEETRLPVGLTDSERVMLLSEDSPAPHPRRVGRTLDEDGPVAPATPASG